MIVLSVITSSGEVFQDATLILGVSRVYGLGCEVKGYLALRVLCRSTESEPERKAVVGSSCWPVVGF